MEFNFKPREITIQPELLGFHSMNSLAPWNSPSRSTMMSSHQSQHLIVNGLEEKIIQSGAELEMGKYTFKIEMPEDGTILKVIPRYPPGIGENSLNFSPETLVIYENAHTHEIDCFTVPYYASYHQFFGFKYEPKDELTMIREHISIPKGTVFADSPGVADNGTYQYTVNANVALMSHPAVSEDGVMVSRQFLERLKFKVYEKRSVEFGSKTFPLNIYGTTTRYQPFPEIGSKLRSDGLLMMLREYDEDLAPVEMSVLDTMEPIHMFDKGVYVRGGEGRVVDIKVISNNSINHNLPPSMCGMMDKYENAYLNFHNELIKFEEEIRYQRRKVYNDNKLNISPKLQNLIVTSMAIVGRDAFHGTKNASKQPLTLTHRKANIDEYRIEFVVEYEITPNIGFKLTGEAGDKGVICKIVDQMDMPVDSDGNRADVVMDDVSTIKRMNMGRLYTTYFGAASRDVVKNIRQMLGYQRNENPKLKFFTHGPEMLHKAYDYLMGFYHCISMTNFEYFRQMPDEDKALHLVDVINRGHARIYMPIGNSIPADEAVRMIQRYYPPTLGPVTYRGNSGRMVTTKKPVRIAPMPMMLLEKIADDWSSIASGKIQVLGVLSPQVKSEKFAYPFRNTPVRAVGETEWRIFVGYCGPYALAEIMDRSNNTAAHRNMYFNILCAPKPTEIKAVVDRTFIPFGGIKPLQWTQHIFMCCGFQSVYEPEAVA